MTFDEALAASSDTSFANAFARVVGVIELLMVAMIHSSRILVTAGSRALNDAGLLEANNLPIEPLTWN